MNDKRLPELIVAGQDLLALIEQENVHKAEELIDHYLNLLDAVFLHASPHSVTDLEHQYALRQFQTLHHQIEHAKYQTEEALCKLSKAGRASHIYKLNAG